MVHMNSGGKPELKVFLGKGERFSRKCYCYPPVLIGDDFIEDGGDSDEEK